MSAERKTKEEVGHIDPKTQAALLQKLKAREDRNTLVKKFILRETQEENAVQQKSAVLASLLDQRRSRDALMQLNVIREEDSGPAVSATFAENQRNLKMAQKKDKLANFISSRPTEAQLRQKNFIQEPGESKKNVKTAQEALGDFMLKRPAPETLVKQKVITDIGDLPSAEEAKDLGCQLTPKEVPALETLRIIDVSAGWGHTIAVTDKGIVYAFGVGASGRLGLGEEEKNDQAQPQVIPSLRDIGKVSDASAGDNHSGAVFEGKLYTWGQGSWGRLGTGAQADVYVPQHVTGIPKEERIIAVACGGYHTVAVSGSGTMFAFGWNKNGRIGQGAGFKEMNALLPLPVSLNTSDPVITVSAGSGFTLALTKGGAVYSWGAGQYGALGHGSVTDEPAPKLIVALVGERITQIAAGGTHALVVSAGPKVYSWGFNHSGQLGREGVDGDHSATPGVVPGLDGNKISAIACGKSSSFAAEGAQTYSWGAGARGVLGHGDEASVKAPKAIAGLAGRRIKRMSCGWAHTAVVTDAGKLLTFGDKKSGKLGYL